MKLHDFVKQALVDIGQAVTAAHRELHSQGESEGRNLFGLDSSNGQRIATQVDFDIDVCPDTFSAPLPDKPGEENFVLKVSARQIESLSKEGLELRTRLRFQIPLAFTYPHEAGKALKEYVEETYGEGSNIGGTG